MRFFRRSPAPSGRQRLRGEAIPKRLNKKFSYRSRRSETELNTGRQLQREALAKTTNKGINFWLQRFGLVILMLAVLVSTINVLTLSAQPKVLSLNGEKNSAFLRDLSVYQAAGGKFLAASIWNRNKITVDAGSISRQMLDRFPELAGASVTVPLLAHRPIIYVQPAKPALILVGRNGAFVVANSGKALLRADTPQALNHPELPLINDQSGFSLKLNRQALPADDVNFIQTVRAQLTAKQFTVESMTLPAAARELDVRLAGQPYTVKFNLQSDKARQQAGTFLSTVAYLKKQNITPGQYVDVRVEGRAYYQ